MSKCELILKNENNKAVVSIAGVIDEDMNFSSYSLGPYKEIEINLKNVKSINSCGIREWIKWLGTSKQATIHFLECPKIIIDQVNMVQGFLPENGRIISFYVPYFSDELDLEKNILYSYGKEFTEEGVLNLEKITDENGNELEIDVVESKYFRFLKKG